MFQTFLWSISIFCLVEVHSKIYHIEEEKWLKTQNDDDKLVLKWRNEIEAVFTSQTDEQRIAMLKEESHKNQETMTVAFQFAESAYISATKSKTCPASLLISECMSVYMYSTEFNVTYNEDISQRRYQSYNVFTALLFSAVKKISEIRPLPEDTIVHIISHEAGDKSNIHFRPAGSASRDKVIENVFHGNNTVVVIRPKYPKYVANVTGMTRSDETEICVSPFDLFYQLNMKKSSAERLGGRMLS